METLADNVESVQQAKVTKVDTVLYALQDALFARTTDAWYARSDSN